MYPVTGRKSDAMTGPRSGHCPAVARIQICHESRRRGAGGDKGDGEKGVQRGRGREGEGEEGEREREGRKK